MIRNPITYATWLFIAVVLAAISGWYYVSSDTQYSLDRQTLSHMPDVIAQQVHLTQYDENGRVKHDMISNKMIHQQADDRYVFMSPKILIIGDKQTAPWKITAKRALSLNGSELIELIDTVHLYQRIDGNKFNEIITNQLYYKPTQKLAYTDKPIEFNQPGTKIKAIGMRANLDKKQVRLLSQAQGAFTHENA